LAGERLSTLLQPDLCRIYVTTGDGHALFFATETKTVAMLGATEGTVPRPAPPSAGRLEPAWQALDRLEAPIEIASHAARRGPLTADTRAVLESLGVAAVVPV